ncbi:MAG: acyl-CoA reductase, partial [Luteibaculum sp.]
MLSKEQLSSRFVEFGEKLQEFAHPKAGVNHALYLSKKREAEIKNPWFTEREINRALEGWTKSFNPLGLDRFLDHAFQFEYAKDKTLAIISAGNIPLVGLHDVLCALLSDCNVVVKPSSDDEVLLKTVCDILLAIFPEWQGRLKWVEHLKGGNFDGVIATGSDNSARYFEYYFREKKHLIRKNRCSVAVLDGSESEEQMRKLALDLFAYFGLGCRSVSKVFIPKDFDVQRIFAVLPPFEYLMDHNKYMNNYTYRKALYLLNQEVFLENGYVMLKETEEMHSPISVIFAERYESLEQVESKLQDCADKIQCRVGVNGVPFGEAQNPG